MSSIAKKLISVSTIKENYYTATFTAASGFSFSEPSFANIDEDGSVLFFSNTNETDAQGDLFSTRFSPSGNVLYTNTIGKVSATGTSPFNSGALFVDGGVKLFYGSNQPTLMDVNLDGSASNAKRQIGSTNITVNAVGAGATGEVVFAGSRFFSSDNRPYFCVSDITNNTAIFSRGVSLAGNSVSIQKVGSFVFLGYRFKFGGGGIIKFNTSTSSQVFNLGLGGSFGLASAFNSLGFSVFSIVDSNTNVQRVQLTDPDGSFVWARSFTVPSSYSVQKMCIDNENNVYLTYDRGSSNFQIFLLKIDSLGDAVYTRSISSNIVSLSSLEVQANGNGLIFTGQGGTALAKVDGLDFPTGTFGSFSFGSVANPTLSIVASSIFFNQGVQTYGVITANNSSIATFLNDTDASISTTLIP